MADKCRAVLHGGGRRVPPGAIQTLAITGIERGIEYAQNIRMPSSGSVLRRGISRPW
jgi:hypothetical protein